MTRYDLFRKRLAPIAFFIVIGLIAYDTCNKQERTRATIVFDYGTVEPQVRQVEGELWMNNASVAQFHRVALEGGRIGDSKFKVSLPAKDGEIRFDIDLEGGVHKTFARTIHVEEGAVVTVPLERDLR
ncbi:MAG TPA: hypothetical protein VL326_21900 [Kofleriaceae bacterium]|nr:hypothetical protein [Kofleriaceae bacterium]